MAIGAVSPVDSEDLRSSRRGLWLLAAVYGAAILVFWATLARFPGESEVMHKVRTSIYPVPFYFLGAAACWWPVRANASSGSVRRPLAAIFLGVGCVMLGIADSIWTWLEWKGLEPFPSIADYFYLAYIPVVLAAVVTMPTRPMPGVTRTRLIVDGLILLAAMFAFSWYFVLGPTVLAEDAVTAVAKGVGIAYPAGDLLLAACLVFIFLRAGDRSVLPILAMMAGGIVAVMAADSAFLYLSLKGTYASGNPIDPLWLVSALSLSMCGRALSVETKAGRIAPAVERRSDLRETGQLAVLRATLPYLLLPLVGSLVMWVATGPGGRGLLAAGVYGSAALLVALILIRQFMFIAENLRLMQRIQEDGLQLRRLNEDLRSAQSELVHSAKMASLGTLSAGVAHELNQPLAIARGLSQQLLAEPDLTEFVREDLKLIESQTGRMMRIIAHLRTFCRTSGHAVEETSLNRVVDESFTLIGAQLQSRGIALECDYDPANPEVVANANELEQVFLNLISNAKDALEMVDDPKLRVQTRVEGDQVVVRVVDNGPGIADEILPRLFEPFYTTKEVGKGTGLGLSISRNLVEKNGGTMSARNVGGAEFTVSLPLASTKTKTSEADAVFETAA